MKKILLFVISLIFLVNLNAFAEDETEKKQEEEQKEQVSEEKDIKKSLEDKLSKSFPKNIRVYDFNPTKNSKGIVTFVEFNDLSCQECLKKSAEIYSQIGEENLQDLKIIYKHIQENPNSLVNRQAFYGMLAGQNKKFWEFKNKMYENSLKDDDSIIQALIDMGLDEDALFNQIVEQGDKLYKNIDIDTQYGMSLKGHATPMFFIDGYRLDEDISLQEVIEYIKLKKQEWLEKQKQLEDKYKVGKI